jgi:hypothetical protein
MKHAYETAPPAHHAVPRKRRFPDAARKARRWRALSRGLLSLLREALVETAVLAALSLASKFRFLGPAAAGGVRLEGYSAASPRWRDHSAGRSQRQAAPIPWGSRPSIAALTRSGARKASEIVMFTLPTLQPSRPRAAITSRVRRCAAADAGLVCRKITTSRRREVLTFSHHGEVAALPVKQQDKWLNRAEKAGTLWRERHYERQSGWHPSISSGRNILSVSG